MSYFRKLSRLNVLTGLFSREENWLIMINADPDAMASAMALKRIMQGRVLAADIAKINDVQRPDNLAMIRYTKLEMLDFSPTLLPKYRRFALVDSQPHHNKEFQGVDFSIVVDHHPLPDEGNAPDHPAPYTLIAPEYGATSTLFTEHLYNLGIRPGKLLATALQFGIKTDTANFQRHFSLVDMRAYQYLSKFADHALLARIIKSEFLRPWLEVFARACIGMHKAGSGDFAWLAEVESPDVLVGIADFFMRVYEIRWVAVAGIYKNTVIVIFRGDGVAMDLGRFASRQFSDLGSAGGHRNMARAEFPLSGLNPDELEEFIFKRLVVPKKAHKAAGRDGGQDGTHADTQRPAERRPGSAGLVGAF